MAKKAVSPQEERSVPVPHRLQAIGPRVLIKDTPTRKSYQSHFALQLDHSRVDEGRMSY